MLKPFARHFAVCAALLAPAIVQAETDLREGLWEVSVRMEVGGQPASAEPLVARQCITQQTAQDLISQLAGTAGGCQIADLRQDGNHASWNLSCSGQIELKGSGEVTISNSSFDGSLDAVVGMGGQSVPVHQTFSARRVGDCQ
jgi:hypothetical protein